MVYNYDIPAGKFEQKIKQLINTIHYNYNIHVTVVVK